MPHGWSVNLTDTKQDPQWVELPAPPLFETTQGPVIEVVFWSQLADRWVHGVSEHFQRDLPSGHIQVTTGDLTWIREVAARSGEKGLRECVLDLEECLVPSDW